MKVFTNIPVAQNEMVKPSSLNDNIDKYLNEWNGHLNGNNLPVFSVQSDDIKYENFRTGFSGAVSGLNTELQTQGYYYKRRSSSFEGSTDVWTPILNLDLQTDDWSKGWNRLEYYSGFSQFPVVFDSREGMLVGCATIDWQHGTDMMAVTENEITFSSTRGDDWVSEWGVFVNDVLVARSGEIPPRRHTTSLPFSIPCGSQNVKVDVRWISTISDYLAVGRPHGSQFLVFSAEVWVRNAVR